MHFSRLATLFFISSLLACIASARLGDTEAELVDRFGKTVGRSKLSIMAQGKSWEMGLSLRFRQDDWNISCDLVDGRCLRISYSKPGDWTEDQFHLVLSANSQGAAWAETSKLTTAKRLRTWSRNDGSTAVWMKMGGMDLVWNAYNVAKKKIEDRAKVEGMKKPKI